MRAFILSIFSILSFFSSFADNSIKDISIIQGQTFDPSIFQTSSHKNSRSTKKQIHVVVVIDVFRAFTTASYILNKHPASYTLALKSNVVEQLSKKLPNILLVGKPEIGATLIYNIPNSPTRVYELDIVNHHVLHRTEAGARGILRAKAADVILAASFVNATATANYIKRFSNPKVTILAMGHEAETPSLEDDLCASYIKALLIGKRNDIKPYVINLKEGPGKYFFDKDQKQYPAEDFDRCVDIDRFDFAICAQVQNDYAILTRCK
jgi:2-phosphosulfolactate phosphatase